MTDITLTRSRHDGAQSWVQRLAARYRNWRARRSVRNLLELDDRMLADIGVRRDEVAWASQLPLAVNAALELEAGGVIPPRPHPVENCGLSLTRSAPDRLKKIVGGIAGPCPGVAGDDVVQRLATAANSTFVVPAALLAWSACAAAKNVAQKVVQRTALRLRRALLRPWLRHWPTLSAAKNVAQQVIQSAAALGLWRGLGRTLLAAARHLLEDGAKHHRGNDRQHLLQDGRTDSGGAGRMHRHVAADLLVAEQVPENGVSVLAHIVVTHSIIVFEITFMPAATERLEKRGQPVVLAGVLPHACRHHWRKFGNCFECLLAVQSELLAQHLKPAAVVRTGDHLDNVHATSAPWKRPVLQRP
jgi:uncharacterized protein YjiS (DUF1127 family)